MMPRKTRIVNPKSLLTDSRTERGLSSPQHRAKRRRVAGFFDAVEPLQDCCGLESPRSVLPPALLPNMGGGGFFFGGAAQVSLAGKASSLSQL